MKLAFLFPGQGSQKVGMGAALVREFDIARRTFDEADAALGFSVSQLCFEGPEEDLRQTVNTQPAILTAAIAAQRIFTAESGITPELAAGHSLGEYGALVAAGALEFTNALLIVRERGRLMQAACPPGQGAMAALIGLDLATVTSLCEAASTDSEIAVPANLNAPDQTVISGHAGPVRKALDAAKARGARASVELNVSAPFHSPLMAPAREGLRPQLSAIALAPLRFPVIANVTAQPNRDSTALCELLLQQITAPVRWEESMRTMVAAGVTEAVEFGPGRVLAGLMRRIDRNVKMHATEEPANLRSAIAALRA